MRGRCTQTQALRLPEAAVPPCHTRFCPRSVYTLIKWSNHYSVISAAIQGTLRWQDAHRWCIWKAMDLLGFLPFPPSCFLSYTWTFLDQLSEGFSLTFAQKYYDSFSWKFQWRGKVPAFAPVYSLAVSRGYLWSSKENKHLIVFGTVLQLASEEELDNPSAISSLSATVLQTVPSAWTSKGGSGKTEERR